MTNDFRPRRWMGSVLLLAGVYNLAWGTVCIAFPVTTLGLLGVDPGPTVPQLWQCIGMIVGVYGLGYLVASRDPFRHWPITLIGLLGKVFGPIGFCIAASSEQLPMSMGWTILTNDLIWLLPFSGILWGAIRHHESLGSAYVMPESDAPLMDLRSNRGERLDELADPRPQLVVFLRHAGCTFCREALADIAEQREQIESSGCGIVLVHMGENDRDEAFFATCNLDDLPRFSDPECRLYRQFGLDMGGFAELLGPMVWFRGFMAALINGHGFGPLRGNGFQMPGVYLYHCGQILGGFQHIRASDRPDYAALANAFSQPEQVAVAI